ncbi:MAG: tryptophan 2,3-dioxygenase family protein [Thermonemataceae bacterium]
MNRQKITDQLKRLEQKYQKTGQDLSANLEGLLHADYLKYWDYIQVDTLLTFQKPRTHFPDEMIFIIYHQITELYFKAILWEIGQVAHQQALATAVFLEKVHRMNRYLEMLVHSFQIMVKGMDIEQFRQFRMALLPSSGFQSAQFRLIELAATDIDNLVEESFRSQITPNTTTKEKYAHLYWKKGATEAATQKKTITLQHFEEEYAEMFLQWAFDYKDCNLWQKWQAVPTSDTHKQTLKEALKNFDYLTNIEWTLAHLKAASTYLKPKGKPIEATGGTNWPTYLPPNLQKRIFFPALWTEEEKEQWGTPGFVILRT